MEVTNKVAIVTGGTGGIGLCISKQLLHNSAKYVAIFDIDNERTRSDFNELKKEYGDRVEFYPCDVSKSKELFDNMDKVIETHKTIDILINNAGVGEYTTGSDPEHIVDINFKAVIMGSYGMIKRVGKENNGQGGVIVNTASIAGIMNFTISPTYCATKHGVVSYTRALADTYETTGVRIVAICPGFTKSHMTASVTDEKLKIAEAKLKKKFKLQSPENVALAVISIIKNGKNGDIWLSHHDEPPIPVNVVDAYPF